MATYFGPDVSLFQPNIDWNKVAAAGNKFAIIKASGGRLKAGKGVFGTYADRCCVQHVNGAYAAGLKVGVYHYYTAVTEAEAIAEFNKFMEVTKPLRSKITLPYVIDLEEDETINFQKLGFEKTMGPLKKFISLLEAEGLCPMIYTNRAHLKTCVKFEDLTKYPFWQAHWSTSKPTDCGNNLLVWQYTDRSNTNTSGITGLVDHNEGYFDLNVNYNVKGYVFNSSGKGISNTPTTPVVTTPTVETPTVPTNNGSSSKSTPTGSTTNTNANTNNVPKPITIKSKVVINHASDSDKAKYTNKVPVPEKYMFKNGVKSSGNIQYTIGSVKTTSAAGTIYLIKELFSWVEAKYISAV